MENTLEILGRYQVLTYLQAVMIIIVGGVLAKIIARVFHRYFRDRIDRQSALIVKKLLFYVLFLLVIFSALDHIGIDLKVLLGAAGIFTVALGFASQTSASNLISGIFLLFEKPFELGDTISVGDTTGIVLSVDLFSTRLRTFDNLFVRIPNETLMKGQINNLTHFPIRRVDISLSISYQQDIEAITQILKKIVDENPLCLDEPECLIIIKKFSQYAIDLQFSVWGKQENYLRIKNELHQTIVKQFAQEGISIPLPQQVTIIKHQ